jgi:hypothetical protein
VNKVKVVYFWSCGAKDCHVVAAAMNVQPASQLLDPRLSMIRPSLPEGWLQVAFVAYCPRHNVTILVEDA